jgi:hypothetical protein
MVTYKDQKTYLKSTGKLFTGRVIRKFDNGIIASMVTYKNGMPNGKWYTNGFDEELIQEGEYLDLKSVKLESVNGFIPSSLSLWTEGDNAFVTLEMLCGENKGKLESSQYEWLYNKNISHYKRKYSEIKLFRNDSLIDTYTKVINDSTAHE